jgi:hypothetical protein
MFRFICYSNINIVKIKDFTNKLQTKQLNHKAIILTIITCKSGS